MHDSDGVHAPPYLHIRTDWSGGHVLCGNSSPKAAVYIEQFVELSTGQADLCPDCCKALWSFPRSMLVKEASDRLVFHIYSEQCGTALCGCRDIGGWVNIPVAQSLEWHSVCLECAEIVALQAEAYTSV